MGRHTLPQHWVFHMLLRLVLLLYVTLGSGVCLADIPSDQLNPKQIRSAEKDLGPAAVAQIQELFSPNSPLEANDLNARLSQLLAPRLNSCLSSQEQEIESDCSQRLYEDAYLVARANGLIDDVILVLLKEHLKDGHSSPLISEYRSEADGLSATRKAVLGNSSDAMSPALTERKPYPQKARDLDHLSPRERLYILYNPIQIRDLSDIFARTLKIMDAKSADISIQPRDDSTPITVDLSEGEIFRLAIDLMKRNLSQEEQSGLLKGTQPKMIDLIAAGEETGALSGSLVTDVLKIPELNDPKSSILKKTGAILEQMGRIALISNPVTQIYGLVGFMFVDAIEESHKKDAGTHDGLF
jgi:hypothetical protein